MCSSKTETPVHSAAPIPTAAFFPKGVCTLAEVQDSRQ